MPSALPTAAADLIDARIQALADWRGHALAHLRALIREAEPAVVEEWKWGVPVWSKGGILCTGETYKKVVKTTFAKGRRCRIPPGCSTPASTARCGARSISMKAGTSTKTHSGAHPGRGGSEPGRMTPAARLRDLAPDPPPDPEVLSMDPHHAAHHPRAAVHPDAVYAAFASPERLARWWGRKASRTHSRPSTSPRAVAGCST